MRSFIDPFGPTVRPKALRLRVVAVLGIDVGITLKRTLLTGELGSILIQCVSCSLRVSSLKLMFTLKLISCRTALQTIMFQWFLP